MFDQAASERLFSTLSYAIFVAPAAVVLIWALWRLLAWGLLLAQGRAPQLFARNTSATLSHVFLFCVALPLVFVPMRYLADRLEGPKILFWHWLLVLGSLAVVTIWFIARLRRKQDWRSRL